MKDSADFDLTPMDRAGPQASGLGSRRTFLRAGVMAGAALASFSLAPGTDAAVTPRRGGTLRIQGGKTPSLNPAIMSGTQTMIPGAQIFAGLVEYDADWKSHPYLAESWETSKDHLAHTFLHHSSEPA